AVVGQRLAAQMDGMGIRVDREHPLCVYLPCGVGGGPGGVAFGLKLVFGDDVHCFFAEPTHSASMFLGLYTGLHHRVSVQDFGLDNLTCADGLAVGRASAFVGKVMAPLMDGVYTVSDENLYRYLALVRDSQGIELEPSALAGFPGMVRITRAGAADALTPALNRNLERATHLVWATGGNMVPRSEREQYYLTGKNLLNP
ncbi:MAG: D-serine ammonia-lyase, partial [Desulfobacterales bacterium]|nr:D-serine ammonia-lyase [Desulfobacterales bacterium]